MALTNHQIEGKTSKYLDRWISAMPSSMTKNHLARSRPRVEEKSPIDD